MSLLANWCLSGMAIQLLLAICLLPTVFGCSCYFPPGVRFTSLQSMCRDYYRSSNVYAGRVINASCTCISPVNNSSYGQASSISCLSGSGLSEYFTSEIEGTCVANFLPYGLLSCDRVLDKFQPTGMLY